MKTIFHKLTLLLLLTASLPLTSCFSDFEPDIPSTPVLCLNSLITEGEVIKVEVTRTWRWSDPETNIKDRYETIVQRDAKVKLFVNDCYVETLSFIREPARDFSDYDKYYYVSDFKPSSGDRIRIEASSDEYGDASAQVTVPDMVSIESIVPHIKMISSNHNDNGTFIDCTFDMTLDVSFSDPADSENFYNFELSDTHTEGYIDDNNLYIGPDYWESIRYYGFDVDMEPLFSEHITPIETILSDNYGWTVFSDRQIEGRRYSLNIVSLGTCYTYNATEKPDKGKHDATLNVRLCNISRSYYDFIISLWQTEQGTAGALSGIGLGNPVWEKSNVSTGAGVVAAQAVSEVRLNALKLVSGLY